MHPPHWSRYTRLSPLIRHAGAVLGLTLLWGGAQANPLPADGQWRGTGGAALSLSSGNASAQSFALNVDMARATAVDRLTLGGAVLYGRSKAEGMTRTTANKWAGTGQYDRNLGPQWYAFGKLGLEADQLIDLDLRTTLAAGLGYKLVDTATSRITVFGGAAYSSDGYASPQTVDGRSSTRFSRSSLVLGEESTHQLTTQTSVKQRLELYPGFSGDQALLLKFSAGLSVAMSGSTSLNLGLTSTYNSKPPEGSKRADVGVLTGVNVKWGGP